MSARAILAKIQTGWQEGARVVIKCTACSHSSGTHNPPADPLIAADLSKEFDTLVIAASGAFPPHRNSAKARSADAVIGPEHGLREC